MTKITIGFAQYRPRFGEREANLKEIERLAGEGAAADLLVFPELGATGYEFIDRAEVRKLGERLGEGPTSRLMLELARRHSMTVVIGYPEIAGPRTYNAAMMATPGGDLFNYRKLHLFSREKELFDPGDAPPPVFQTPAGRVGLMICFDWIFPETARLLALGGAQIIAHPSNLVLAHCQRSMYARCVENRVFAITANRTGTESRAGRELTFTGSSQVLGPNGETLAQAAATAEAIGLAEIDPTEADDKHVADVNDLLADRRVEFYEGLMGKADG